MPARTEFAQDGDKHGLPGWWTVYHDGEAIHHYPDRSDAATLAFHMNGGLDYEQAKKKVAGE
jgi:hypothetical protein